MSSRGERHDEHDPVEAVRGAKLGKYQLLAVLGRGGMADVFLALSRGPMGFSKLVVVKRLRSTLSDDPSFRDMFLDEARLAARLNHPHVVQTHEVGEADGVYFLAMEYLEGQSLNKWIRQLSKRGETLPPAMCARIVSDALSGLHYAHELKDFDGSPLGIIHRDVSPHNVFVTYDGNVKMVDFGIAKAALSSVETEVGVLKGKVAYMAPEQAAGDLIDPRADVFAMGIVLWELLAQERLMTGDSAAATLHRLLTAPIRKVTEVRSDVPPALAAIVERALEKSADDRFASALEMRDALEGFIVAEGRPVRQEEIGRELSRMFSGVREAIQKQISTHMEGVTEVPLREAEAEGRADVNATTGSLAELPMLGVTSGSGSGVVSAFSTSSPSGSASVTPSGPLPQSPAAVAEGKRGVALWLGLAAVVSLVAVVAFTMGQNRGTSAGPAADDSVTQFSGSAAAAPPPPPPRSAQPAVAATPPPADVPPAPQPQAPPAVANGKKPALAATPATTPKTKGHDNGASPAATTAPGGDDTSGQGYLTLDTYPWTQVSENGKSLGTTPIVHLALPAGPHTLTLENTQQGISQPYAVTIKSGETLSRRVGLK